MPSDFTAYGKHHCEQKVQWMLERFCHVNRQRSFAQLHRDTKFADLTLLASDEAFKVHRTVMVSCSPYFHKILRVMGVVYIYI
jgi:hypothetical protein